MTTRLGSADKVNPGAELFPCCSQRKAPQFVGALADRNQEGEQLFREFVDDITLSPEEMRLYVAMPKLLIADVKRLIADVKNLVAARQDRASRTATS